MQFLILHILISIIKNNFGDFYTSAPRFEFVTQFGGELCEEQAQEIRKKSNKLFFRVGEGMK